MANSSIYYEKDHREERNIMHVRHGPAYTDTMRNSHKDVRRLLKDANKSHQKKTLDYLDVPIART